MFRTNNCPSSGGYFCTRSILPCIYALSDWNPIDTWQNTVRCVYRNNLLMMNNYLFESCRGYQSSIYSPTDARVSCLKNNIKIYIKIYNKTAVLM